MAQVFLGLGSNIDAERNLKLGVAELRRRFGDLTVSKVYRSKPVGFDGEEFLNLVAGLETDATPEEIEASIEEIHTLAGRQRGGERYSSRSLDIDLLLYGDLVRTAPKPCLPRSDILKYSFVLRPLAEIAPNVRHPLTGLTIMDHWNDFDAAGHPLTTVDVIL